MKPFTVVFALFMWVASMSVAVAQKSDALSPTGYIANLFEALAKGNSDEGFDALFKSNPWMDSHSAGVSNIKAQYRAMASQLGKYCGYDPVFTKNITNRLVYMKVVVYYERQPIEFTFIFSKPQEHWQIQSYHCNTEVEQFAPELIKNLQSN